MWFSLNNCMVVLGLATSHHDSEIAGTFAQQLGWVFVGPFHPSAHGPPAKLRSFTSLQMVHTHTRTHTHIYIYIFIYTPSLSRARTHTRTHAHTRTRTHTHTRTHAHTHTRTHAHTHTDIYIYIHYIYYIYILYFIYIYIIYYILYIYFFYIYIYYILYIIYDILYILYYIILAGRCQVCYMTPLYWWNGTSAWTQCKVGKVSLCRSPGVGYSLSMFVGFPQGHVNPQVFSKILQGSMTCRNTFLHSLYSPVLTVLII